MIEPCTIRPMRSPEDYRACVALQEETWGAGFSERVPPAVLKVSQLLSGVAAGAFDDADRMVGFVFGMTGPRDGEVVHWSDMLAVRPEWRDRGLGRRLKAYQRDCVVAQGVGTMFWTFDPLQARNARLNFSRLGIVVGEYVRDMYGDTDSPLHHGIGTDRFVATWRMLSARVLERLEGVERGPAGGEVGTLTAALAVAGDGPHPAPGVRQLGLAAGPVLVAIPSHIGAIMREDPELAHAWRLATREVLVHYLARGWEVRELVRGARTCHYLLEPPARDS